MMKNLVGWETIKLQKGSFNPRVGNQRKVVKKDSGIFNTVFETALRIILLTSSSPDILFSSTRILALDFINCYAKAFGLASENLHGNNDFMYGELAGRRLLITEAIKRLVRNGILQVQNDCGYRYKITAYGIELSSNFLSTYAQQYCRVAKTSAKKYGCKSDEELIMEIQSHPGILLKE